jgi:hypothetical protein
MTELDVPFGKALWRTVFRSFEKRHAQVCLPGKIQFAKLLLADDKARKNIT